MLQELEDKLAKTEARTEQYETRVRKATETITVLKDGIQDVFEKIGCSQNGVTEMLGTTGEEEEEVEEEARATSMTEGEGSARVKEEGQGVQG